MPTRTRSTSSTTTTTAKPHRPWGKIVLMAVGLLVAGKYAMASSALWHITTTTTYPPGYQTTNQTSSTPSTASLTPAQLGTAPTQDGYIDTQYLFIPGTNPLPTADQGLPPVTINGTTNYPAGQTALVDGPWTPAALQAQAQADGQSVPPTQWEQVGDNMWAEVPIPFLSQSTTSPARNFPPGGAAEYNKMFPAFNPARDPQWEVVTPNIVVALEKDFDFPQDVYVHWYWSQNGYDFGGYANSGLQTSWEVVVPPAEVQWVLYMFSTITFTHPAGAPTTPYNFPEVS